MEAVRQSRQDKEDKAGLVQNEYTNDGREVIDPYQPDYNNFSIHVFDTG